MELWLAVQTPEGRIQHVSVETEADCSAARLTAGLADHLGVVPDQPLSLYCERLGAWLGDDTTVEASGLRQGDRLLLGAAGIADRWRPGRTPAGATVTIESDDTGLSAITLRPGEYTIGRDPDCEIALDDPSVSRKHARINVSVSGAAVVDLASTNGTLVGGRRLEPDAAVVLAPSDQLQVGAFRISVQPSAPTTARRGWVEFNRPPRVATAYDPPRLRLDRPPADPQPPRLPLIASAAPLLLGVVLFAATHPHNPAYLSFALLTPVMAFGSYVEDRRHGSGSFRKAAAEFREELNGTASALEAARVAEGEEARRASPGLGELVATATSASARLWERRGADDDFGRLRIGLARRPSNVTVDREPGGSEALAEEAEQRLEPDATIPDVPGLAELARHGSIGLCGDRKLVVALARWLAVQLTVLHSPRDLVLAAAIADDEVDEWAWLKWLPHIRDPGSPVDGPHLAAGPAQARHLLSQLAAIKQAREQPAGGRRAAPFVAVLLDESIDPDRAQVASILADGPASGIGAIWMGSRPGDLPSDCTCIVQLSPGGATVTDAVTGETVPAVAADVVDPSDARAVARALAPMRDATAAYARRGIPSSLGLLELLEVDQPTADWVAQRWAQPHDRLPGVIGMGADGPFVLDVAADGPHGLIGGTTGAGKSELLQTIVASLACAHPPDRLTYLLVDYKGGAAFKDCTDLPHTVGFVTDLDSELAERALESLAAELRRRERLLRDAGVASLDELRRAHPEAAAPRLMIVIDEFATLAQELPAFVDGVVDIARRGRTLGLHLVLATQRPRGAVNDNIRANTNLRIALRVVDAGESTDVLDAPDAAWISRSQPGRGFARTGHSDLNEFQTAFAGSRSPAASADDSVRVSDLGFGWVAGREAGEAASATDLERLVEAVCAANRTLGLPQQPSPWLPPLAEQIPLASLDRGEAAPGEAVLGMVDDPAGQRQLPFAHDLDSEGGLIVYGAGGAGKTTLMRTFAASLAASAGAADLYLYGLDGSSGGLSALARLPQCGSVIDIDDAPRVERLFALLRAEIEQRRRAAVGAGDHGAPRIVVLLDGYEGFRAAYERADFGELVEGLPRVVNDGRSLGVHFVITANRRGAIPGVLANAVPRRVALRQASPEEYAAVGLSGRGRRSELPAGRGYSPDDLTLQIAFAGTAPDVASQAAGLAAIGQAAAERFGAARAPEIRLLPDQVERSQLPHATPPEVVIGVRESTLKAVGVSLDEGNVLVVGPRRGGRTTALRTIAAGLAQGGAELWLFAPRRTDLAADDIWAQRAQGPVECAELAAELQRRLGDDPKAARLVAIVDDGEELADGAASAAFDAVVKRSRDASVRVVAAVERNAAHRAFTGWLREMRQDQQGVLLSPVVDVDGDLLGARLPRRASVTFPPGRGYLVTRGAVELIQVAR